MRHFSQIPPNSEPEKRWQVSIRQLLIATAILAVVCGTIGTIVRIYPSHPTIAVVAGAFFIPVLLSAAAGVVIGNAVGWLIGGILVGAVLSVGTVGERAEAVGGIVSGLGAIGDLALIIVVINRWLIGSARIQSTPARASHDLRVSVSRLSVIASLLVLVIWLPVVFLGSPMRRFHVGALALLTICFICPMVLVAVAKAIREGSEARQASGRLAALAIALVPVAIFLTTQWLILWVSGIRYKL